MRMVVELSVVAVTLRGDSEGAVRYIYVKYQIFKAAEFFFFPRCYREPDMHKKTVTKIQFRP